MLSLGGTGGESNTFNGGLPQHPDIGLPQKEVITVNLVDTEIFQVQVMDLFNNELILINPSNVPLPLLEYVGISFEEKEILNIKVGDLLDSDTIDCNIQTLDYVPLAPTYAPLQLIFEEVPTKLNLTTFRTRYSYIGMSLKVYLNGLEEFYITKLTSNTFAFEIDTLSDDMVTVDYIKA